MEPGGKDLGPTNASQTTWAPPTVQLRLDTKLTSEEYITQRAWQNASLRQCPRHQKGGCGFRSCGSYGRRRPVGLRIRRWYCPKDRVTFSLIPDFAATRVAATLVEIEEAVLEATKLRDECWSFELAARALRPDIEPQGAIRWLRRRCSWVSAALAVLIGLAPELLAGCEPSLASVRLALGGDCVLVRVREIAADQLAHLPAPLGFAPLGRVPAEPPSTRQHNSGPDPPASPS